MNGMIVAAQPEAVEAGALVLRRGGNAVDAAIACAFVQGVVDPQMTGIAGYGSMQVYMPRRGVHEVLEFYARSPRAVRDEMWADKIIGEAPDGFSFVVEGQVNEIGHQAVGSPGNLKGYTTALADYGTMELADIMAPAIGHARDGFMIRPYMHYYMTLDQSALGRVPIETLLRFSATGRQVYCRGDGSLKRPGDIVANPDLARTLERIAASGPDIFYRGEIAQQIAADMQAHGGLLAYEDLADYELRRSAPVWGSYRGHRIASVRPPGGGVSLIQLLHVLESFPLGEMEHNGPEHLRLLTEALKRVTSDKDTHIGDPEFVEVPVDRLLSKDYAASLADSIGRGEKASIERMKLKPEPNDTTQVCVVDGEGNAVTLTHTLNIPSGVITDGLGFMYNGLMSAFDPRPGRPGSLAPNKGRTSSQMPSIVFRDEQPFIVIGAPGGTAILPAMAQGISNVIDFGMPIFDAVAAPRISVTSNTIDVSNRVPRYVAAALESEGYRVARSYQGFAFAALHAVLNDGGTLSAGADPQRDGMWLRG
ncbi:gamma-glutamyltransferase [Bosea sp. Root381]|uniref:gamma-glutamyltransferase n=1 Tax=Bosea sp. Root381 TaxID=1736524 RepID=UPI0006F5CF6F|nr:gamma-glutamyltransferase [Bosea sp. Root381]KRD96311.1 gamma-glutamyltransferase [Bosea sp. Root381]